MEQSKNEFLPVLQGVKLSKTQSPTTVLCLGHRFYKVCHAVYQIYCIPCTDLAREYNSDLRVDHWTLVKIILSGIRIYFSIMEVTKRFVVKGYVDASF